MSTLSYCSKQAEAMAEYETHRAKAKLDDAIDAEEARSELIAARTQELVVQRMAEMAPIDIVAGMQSILERAAESIRPHILAGRYDYVGVSICALINLYIREDSEVMANDWIEKVERELADWEN